MTRPARLIALALARAMLAGPPSAASLAARMRRCLGDVPAPWIGPLAARCAALPRLQWLRLEARSLATLVERDELFTKATAAGAESPPYVRHYLLREAAPMALPPLALQACALPTWPNAGALAAGLALSPAGLWRLTRPAAWRRRTPLGEQHYRSHLLRKRSGGWRLLEVPEPYLKAVQRRLLTRLLDAIPPHEAACGYVRGRSVLDHAGAHLGQAVLLRFDLRDFFASVRASRVHALFATLGYPQTVARELTALCTVATPEPVLLRLRAEGGLTFLQAQKLRDPHLPQGAPSSPALANLCAFGLDLRLQGLATSLGARYTRYADDLVFSGPASLRAAAARVEAWVGRIALEEGFALNHRKSRCQPASQRQSACGVVVNTRTNLPRDEFDRLKAVLHNCVRLGPASQNREGRADWRAHLQGRIGWAARLNPAKAERLQRLFARIDWG